MLAALSLPVRAAIEVGSGSSDYSLGRKIVQNGHGFWVFFNAGYPAVSFSADGITWSPPAPILSTAEESNMNPQPAIYYVQKTSDVFVAASPNSDGGLIYLARAALNAAGTPSSWTTNSFSPDVTVNGRPYASRSAGQMSVTITVDGNGDVIRGWTAIRAYRTNSTSRDGLLVTRFNPTTLAALTKRGDDANAVNRVSWPVVAQVNSTGDVVVLYKAPGNGTWRLRAFEDGTGTAGPDASVNASPSADNPDNAERTASGAYSP